jgi:hypothetical protein
MTDTPKRAIDMTPAEYAQARAAAIRHRPGMTSAEIADLAERRGEKPAAAKSAPEMTDAEYAAARSKTIRGSYP